MRIIGKPKKPRPVDPAVEVPLLPSNDGFPCDPQRPPLLVLSGCRWTATGGGQRPVQLARAWRAMGGRKLITYTLQSESGESLRGAGFRVVAECKGGGWNRPNIGRSREWQPIYGQQKLRWEVDA